MSNFKERIYQGLQGKYEGLKNGFDRLNNLIYNTQRKTYTLVGGLSGSGKTTLVNFMLINSITDAEKKGIPIDVFYYSYEIDKETTKANWLSLLIYNKHKIVIPPELIAGLGNNRLNTQQLELVESELENLDNLFNRINFRFEADNPTGIFKELREHAEKRGEFIYEPYGNENKKRITGYKFHDENRYVLVVMDHIALMKLERGFSLKENIDKYSEYCISLRNICGYSFFNIQQFNNTLNTTERQKFKGVDLSPQQNDFKDSSNPYQDADVVLGVMNPWKMDMKECLGYDLEILKEHFRMVKVIKNRRGKDNTAYGTYYNPLSGLFVELPLPNSQEIHKIYNTIKNRSNSI